MQRPGDTPGDRASVELAVGARTVRISNPDRVYFSARGETKLDLARYYLSVGDGHRARAARAAVHAAPLPARRRRREGPPEAAARRGARRGSRPSASTSRSGRHADELCVTELASVIWAVQMSTVEFHPWNSRRGRRRAARRVAHRPRSDAEVRLRRRCGASPTSSTRCSTSSAPWAGRRPRAATACTSTSGSSRAGASATSAAPRSRSRARSSAASPSDVTTTWWRKDREPDKVFVDYNQNARDHTIASAYSVRGRARGRRCRRRSPGMRSTTSCRSELHDRDRARPLRPTRATCTRASTRRCSRSSRCWSGRSATSAGGVADGRVVRLGARAIQGRFARAGSR